MELVPIIRFARSWVLKDRPVYVHFAVTDRCNLRCKACNIWKRKNLIEELSIGDIIELAEVLSEMGCTQLSLGGGEPPLRDDLPLIVKTFREKQIRTRVLTNGVTWTPEIATRLLDTGLKEVSFSLDSLDPNIQNRLDGAKGTFRTRIDNLLDFTRRIQGTDVLCLINTMATPLNLDTLESLLDFAGDLGCSISFIPIHQAKGGEKAHTFFSKDSALAFEKVDETRIRKTYDRLIQRKKQGAHILNSTKFLKGSPEYLITGRAGWKCLAGSLYISISPDGLVSPCHQFEGQWGIPFREFPAVYRSESYRAELKGKVASCEGCYRPCWTEVSYLMTDVGSLWEMTLLQLGKKPNPPTMDEEAIREKYGFGRREES